MLAQQTISAFSDISHVPPMAPDADLRPALDGVTPADLGYRPDNAAIVIERPVIAAELKPAGIMATARPLRGRGSFWE